MRVGMRSAGYKLVTLVFVALVLTNAQCVAYCASGMCPHPAESGPHSHCHPQKAPANQAHNCAAQQPFFAPLADTLCAPAVQAALPVPSVLPPLAVLAATFPVPVEPSPPPPDSSTTLILRV